MYLDMNMESTAFTRRWYIKSKHTFTAYQDSALMALLTGIEYWDFIYRTTFYTNNKGVITC